MTGGTLDAVVVGAGPAGVAAATALARTGQHVLLVDRAVFPRDKCCGDGLTTGALRRLEALGLDPARVPSWQPVAEARVRVPGGRQIRLPLPDDGRLYAASARRIDLDAALVEVAASAGAEVRQGCAVTGVAAGPGGTVALDLAAGGRVAARYVVAADGVWSPVRRALGLTPAGYRGEWHAVRRYVERTGPGARALWVWFEEDLLPGYAWSFPLPGGGANVGFGIRRSPGRPPGAAGPRWEDLVARPHVAEVLGPGARPAGPLRAWAIPAGIGTAPLSGLGGRVLFAGDAARAPDTMTGEGIAQALETGALAAEAIGAAGPWRPAVAAARYARRVRRGLAVDDRLAGALSGVLAHRRGADGWLPIADLNDWTRRNFARWMFEDYPRAALVTPHRWRRGLLHQPGAFAGPGAAP